MPPSLKNVEQNATRPSADLVWIVLSCQATQAGYSIHDLAQHLVSDGGMFHLIF